LDYIIFVRNTHMKLRLKHIFIASTLTLCIFYGFAERGLKRKAKNRVQLNVTTETSFVRSIPLNLKNGMKLKGDMLICQSGTSSYSAHQVIRTYQKGNTVYILPLNQKILVPELQQGYTGMKLTLRSRN